MARRPTKTFACPHCGATVLVTMRACPECGSDERTGWKSEDEIAYQAVEIPDTYDPKQWEAAAGRPARWVRITALVVAVCFLISISWYGIALLFG